MTAPGEENSPRSVPPASLAATIMVAWLLAIPLSTAIAEILLASGIVIALFARTRAGTDDSWPMG